MQGEQYISSELIGYEGLEKTYRKEKRLSHPEVFLKYFTLSVPTREVPDQVVESFIENFNELDCEEISADFKNQVVRYGKEERLIEFLKKISLFREKITPMAARGLIKSVYKNPHLFKSEGRSVFQDSEMSAANRLLFTLIAGKLQYEEIGHLLLAIVEETPSFALAVRTVEWAGEEERSWLKNSSHGSFEALKRKLGDRLTAYFIEGRRDIFVEEKSYGYILAQWGTYSPQDKGKINEYIFQRIEENHSVIGKALVIYLSNLRNVIRREDLIKLYDENRLYEQASLYRDSSYSSNDEKKAVDAFISQYEEGKGKAEFEVARQSNKMRFIEEKRQGDELFHRGEYEVALEKFDRALSVTNWNDEFNWVPQVNLGKWKALLELALNREGHEREQFFKAAQEIASYEKEIQGLFKAGYPEGADQEPKELYCCIFYYLQWDVVSSSAIKGTAKQSFYNHFNIAINLKSSGHSGEIINRCHELEKKIRP